MDRVSIAKDVAARLFAAEDSIDGSLKQASRLMGTMIDARRDLRLAAVVGEDVFKRTAGAIAALAEAREEIVKAHDALAVTRDKLGMKTVALGVLDKPDDPNSPVSPDMRAPDVYGDAPLTADEAAVSALIRG